MESTIRKNATAGRKTAAVGRILIATAASIAISIIVGANAFAKDMAPELVSRVWLEGNSQYAAVTLNGDEIARFKADDADDDDAAEEAEDLALKLDELVNDKKFDASLLSPAADEDKAVIKYDGNTFLKFDPFAGREEKGDNEKRLESQALEASRRIVSSIRSAFNAPAWEPNSVVDIATKIGNKLEMLGQQFSGAASWYGGRFHGRKCSDGSRYDQERLTAAHRSLPFGTKVLVKNRKTGDSCVVEVNDRGPFIDGRVIDLSKAAARELHMLSSGIAYVECTILQ